MKLVRRVKCAHCALPLLNGELVVFEQGALFHRPCLRVKRSTALMEDSQECRQRSREIVEAARKVFLAHRMKRSAHGRSVVPDLPSRLLGCRCASSAPAISGRHPTD
jgi:hypothetical protein